MKQFMEHFDWLLFICLFVRLSLAAETSALSQVRHQCFPLHEGALVKVAASPKAPHSVLFFHNTDSLATSIPTEILPLSSVGKHIPLIHNRIVDTHRDFEVCTRELVKLEVCAERGLFRFNTASDPESEVINVWLKTAQVLRIKDSGVWCLYHAGDGEMAISFEDTEGSVWDQRAEFVFWCLVLSVVIVAGVVLYKWRGKQDAYYNSLRMLTMLIILHQLFKFLGLCFRSDSLESLATFDSLTVLSSVLLYSQLYFLAGNMEAKLTSKGHLTFLSLVTLRAFPLVYVPVELLIWCVLLHNATRTVLPSVEKASPISTAFHPRRFPRTLFRWLMSLFVVQYTILISYPFWETVMFDFGHKSPFEKYSVLFSERLVTMLVDGDVFDRCVVLMDDTVWCLVLGLIAYYL